MTDFVDDIVDAVQRISAKDNPYLESRLNKLLKRGTLSAERGIGGSAEEDCCNANKRGTTNDGSNTTDADGLIPDDYDFGDHLEQLCGLNDCDTGEPVCVNFSGTFTPPDGWDSLTEGPIDDTYQSGTHLNAYALAYAALGATNKATATAAVTEIANRLDGVADAGYFTLTSTSYVVYDWGAEGMGYMGYANGTLPEWYADPNPTDKTYQIKVTRRECTGQPEATEACAVTAEETAPTTWPADGIPQIGLIDGSFVSHKADPDGGAYKYPANTLQLCDGAGKAVTVAPDKFGGYLVIPTDPTTGEYIDGATATRYDQNGDVSESGGKLKAEEAAWYILPPP